jgi:hypothetical protein
VHFPDVGAPCFLSCSLPCLLSLNLLLLLLSNLSFAAIVAVVDVCDMAVACYSLQVLWSANGGMVIGGVTHLGMS